MTTLFQSWIPVAVLSLALGLAGGLSWRPRIVTVHSPSPSPKVRVLKATIQLTAGEHVIASSTSNGKQWILIDGVAIGPDYDGTLKVLNDRYALPVSSIQTIEEK